MKIPLIHEPKSDYMGFCHSRANDIYVEAHNPFVDDVVSPITDFSRRFSYFTACVPCFVLTICASLIYAQPAYALDQPSWTKWAGNGHWYALVAEQRDWNAALLHSYDLPGNTHLATLGSRSENDFLFDHFIPNPSYPAGPWVGGFQPKDSPEPAGNWRWIGDGSFRFSKWANGEPNNGDGSGDEQCLEFAAFGENVWNDLFCSEPREYIVESDVDPYADVPQGVNTDRFLPIVTEQSYHKIGLLETYADRDWYRVSLQQNRLYAFGLQLQDKGAKVALVLRSPNGQRIVSTIHNSSLTDNGISFRASQTGEYFIEVVRIEGTGKPEYSISADADCPGSRSLACSARIGNTYGFALTWHNDRDNYYLSLCKGKTYTLDVFGNSFIRGLVYDDKGLLLSSSNKSFRAPYTGRYYVVIKTIGNLGTSYRFRLDAD